MSGHEEETETYDLAYSANGWTINIETGANVVINIRQTGNPNDPDPPTSDPPADPPPQQ